MESNPMKNNAKARSSPPRFKNRRKHNSGGNKNVHKANKEQVKFQPITKVASEIGSSNNGTMIILQRSPARSPTLGLMNGKQSPITPCLLDNPCPPLVSKDGTPEPTATQQLVDGKSYAGSRFHTPPRADLLPKPPTHWISCNMAMARSASLFANQSFNMNMHLKGLLKVQA